MTSGGDALDEAMETIRCADPGCGARAAWMDVHGAWRCEAHHVLDLVVEAHAAIVALSPEDRARFDAAVQRWAEETVAG